MYLVDNITPKPSRAGIRRRSGNFQRLLSLKTLVLADWWLVTPVDSALLILKTNSNLQFVQRCHDSFPVPAARGRGTETGLPVAVGRDVPVARPAQALLPGDGTLVRGELPGGEVRGELGPVNS